MVVKLPKIYLIKDYGLPSGSNLTALDKERIKETIHKIL